MRKCDYTALSIMKKVDEKMKKLAELHSELMQEINHRIINNDEMENLIELESKLYNLLSDEVADFQNKLLKTNLKKNSMIIREIKENDVINYIRRNFNKEVSSPIVIAGPCAIESYEQLNETVNELKRVGVNYIRGGAYKPRSSPYDFQGLEQRGLEYLHDVGKKSGLITVSEIVNSKDLPLFEKYIDILQVGARNMQNYELLKAVGKSSKPVLLKRGLSATVKEFLLAAEYIALSGNKNIILCERGIRTFETGTRNTLDISSIPIIKSETNLPIIADISHSIGRKDITSSIAKSVLAVGADGFMVEVHRNPLEALCDSEQQLNLDEFESLIKSLGLLR